MHTEKPILTDSITAAAALAANLFIGFDGNVCGANGRALGVSRAATASGQQAPVGVLGIFLVKSGGVISAAGTPVKSDSAGKAVAMASFAAAAPAITVDDTKLTIDSGAVAVLSSAADGAVISAASGLVTAAAPALSGGILPEICNGIAMDTAGGADELIRVLRV